TGNSAGSTGIGGGIFNQGPITITNHSILSENSALYGGGIHLSSGDLEMDNSRFEDNQAGWGAGMNIGDATAEIEASALLANDASENDGGGAFRIGETTTLTISGSCIAGNTVGSGSGSGISNPDSGTA